MYCFRYFVYLLVFIGYSISYAGSYDDFFQALERDEAFPVKTLLKRGFDPNSVDPRGEPALIAALRQSAFQVAQVLLDNPATDVNVRSAKAETPLMLAAIKGELGLCRQLIARDADINHPGWTPLHYAASFEGRADVVNLLLANFAYIDAASPNGTTPLMMAAGYGSIDALKALLAAGADASLKNARGLTALDFATQADRPEGVDLIARALRGVPSGGDW